MGEAGKGEWRWNAAAAFLMLMPLLSLFGEVWLGGIKTYVPVAPDFKGSVGSGDLDVVVGRVAHNARALVTRPWAIFDDEACHPASHALAIGDPMIALGLLGAPAHLVSGDPVATFNFAHGAVTWLAGMAMYLLIKSWTGLPAAGVGAGLMYAFHPDRVWNAVHPFTTDTAWTVLALLFAERLFRKGRWRDAIGLAITCGMQMAESFYPFLASICIAIPFAGWLLYRYRFGPSRGPMIGAVVLIGLFAAAIFGPYLAVLGGESAETKIFLDVERLRPGGLTSWFALALAGVALVAPHRLVFGRRSGDPRWALLAALPLVLAVACLPSVYMALASCVPELSAIRAPALVGGGAVLVLSVLAGLGAAALLRAAPSRWLLAASVVFLALAYVDTLRPAFLGLELLRFDGTRLEFEPHRVRPEEETLEFYRRLEELGNEGPILEHPVEPGRLRYALFVAPKGVLTAAYHRRRTSACAMSFIPPVVADVADVSTRLPSRAAVKEAEALGFSTIVVRRKRKGLPGLSPRAWQRFEREANRPGAPLRLIHQTPDLAAYEIVPFTAAGPALGRPAPAIEPRGPRPGYGETHP